MILFILAASLIATVTTDLFMFEHFDFKSQITTIFIMFMCYVIFGGVVSYATTSLTALPGA